jgi:hypothetical protein
MSGTAFHFDLRHVHDAASLRINVHGWTSPLQPHTTDTRLSAQAANPALGALPAEAASVFSHFVEVDEALFPKHNVGWIRIEREPRPGVHLAQVVLMAQHIPPDYLRAYYEERLALYKQPLRDLRTFFRPNLKVRPHRHSAKLASLGLQALPANQEAALDALVHAQTLVVTLDTAGALVSHHPGLANTQCYTASVVMHDHILPDPELDPEQYNRMKILEQAITNDPDWSPVIECKDQHGKPLKAEYELDGFTPGQQLYTWGIAEPVVDAAGWPTAHAQRTASDDMRLENKTWTPTPGTAMIKKDGPTEAKRSAARTETVSYKWTVTARTNHFGISVDENSIKVDGSDKFSINALNGYLRTVYWGYQLFDETGGKIGKREVVDSISAVNVLLGIPVLTDPTALEFKLSNAASAELYFGSFGAGDWDKDVSDPGALMTGLWQYGIPIVFLVVGKAITSTKTFNDIWKDKQLRHSAYAIAFSIVGGGVPTAAGVFNTKKVLFGFADAVLTFVLQKGMEELGKWLVKEAGKGAIAKAFGPLGWLFQLAAAGMNFQLMAITTGQALTSPASIKVQVSRAIDVKLELLPDPNHGESGHPETSVWPSVATVYTATLEYKGGTSFQLRGPMSPTTNSQPIELFFETVPAGGQFRLIAGVYSANGWLAGSWQSDWLEAKPNQGSTLDLGKRKIEESLVPLAPTTQYVYKEKIAYANDQFIWDTGAPPSTTRAALDCGPNGTVCELVKATINNSAFQVGYAWRASGQGLRPDSGNNPPSDEQLYAVQNLSVLEKPNSRLMTTEIGFTNRPAIAYALSTNRPDEIDQTNFVLDPRGGGMNLRQVLLNGSPDFGFGNPNLPSWGKYPLENVDALVVHPSNTVIAASWSKQKLMILPLPKGPSADDKAPEALLVSGEGIRQGLLNGPKALAVSPDGRILVLETTNRRVQSFDNLGNEVPSFTPFPEMFLLDRAAIAGDLDHGKVPEAFQSALVDGDFNYQFTIPASFIPKLDSGRFDPQDDPLITALSHKGVILAYDPEHMQDPSLSAQIQVVERGRTWIVTDPRRFAWEVVSREGALSVYQRLTDVEVRVQKPGQAWLLVDRRSLQAWQLAPSTAEAGKTRVQMAVSWFPLRGLRVGSIEYLDMAVEAEGYVYVLSYQGDGSKTEDYLLDVYGPDGAFLLRSPDPSVTPTPQNVVAGRIAVDIWRNLYALTFESLRGPKGRPQPGLAHWTPTPPLFELDLKLQKDLNDLNIGVIVKAFAEQKPPIHLSLKANIEVIDKEGSWAAKDGATIYYIYRSGEGLQVYSVSA